MEKVKIISVHYKTPELIYTQYETIRKFYPNLVNTSFCLTNNSSLIILL
jgi:hypothetical protein